MFQLTITWSIGSFPYLPSIAHQMVSKTCIHYYVVEDDIHVFDIHGGFNVRCHVKEIKFVFWFPKNQDVGEGCGITWNRTKLQQTINHNLKFENVNKKKLKLTSFISMWKVNNLPLQPWQLNIAPNNHTSIIWQQELKEVKQRIPPIFKALGVPRRYVISLINAMDT